ncbi:MAG: hypothetical protein H7227_08770 [Actinobacteria bacterium]|nr:hypothetical protein [Actinomycetota bacterium]
MTNLAKIDPFNMRWCLVLSLVLVITLLPVAEAATSDYSPKIGSTCSREIQVLPGSPTNGGILICTKDKSGLHWRDLRYVTADKYLDSILSSCNLSTYSPPLKVSADHLKIFTRLATTYFDKRNLLPIKILQVNKAVRKYRTVGIHVCSNGVNVSPGAWNGFIPLNASEGWLVNTMHKMNGFGNSLLLQIVKIGSSYKIVGAVSGP